MIDINFDYSKAKGSTQLHEKLKKEFVIMVARTFSNAIVIPYDVGFYRAWKEPEKPVRCGLAGVPDLICFLPNSYLLFDAKTGKNKFQENQKLFALQLKNLTGREKVFKLSTIKHGLEIIEKELQATNS